MNLPCYDKTCNLDNLSTSTLEVIVTNVTPKPDGIADLLTRWLEPKPVSRRKHHNPTPLTNQEKRDELLKRGFIPGAVITDDKNRQRVLLKTPGPDHKPYSERPDLNPKFYVVTLFQGKSKAMSTRVEFENTYAWRVTGKVTDAELNALRARYLK